MKTVTARIRIFSVEGSPTVAMSATATDREVKAISDDLGFVPPVILRASPVPDHMSFQAIERPSIICGADGRLDKSGKFHPGLNSLLRRIYLDYYTTNLKSPIIGLLF